jgi:hypothetical protein
VGAEIGRIEVHETSSPKQPEQNELKLKQQSTSFARAKP